MGIEQRLSVVARRQATWHVPLTRLVLDLLEHLALQRISPTVEGLLSPDQALLLTIRRSLQTAPAAVWLGQ